MIFVTCFLALLAAWTANAAGVGCGRQADQYPPSVPPQSIRIVGGGFAKPHSWPWQVSLRSGENGKNHRCGGSILRVSDDKEESDIVLTAAHCVPRKNGTVVGDFSKRLVVIGSHIRNVTAPGQQVRKIANITIHENYKGNANDVAIILLESSVQFGDTIRPACLPQPDDPIPVGQSCVATGWGRDQTGHLPQELKQTVAVPYDKDACKRKWGGTRDTWDYAFLCAGVKDGSSSVCSGDSGGPLVCEQPDGTWIQHGVAGFVAGKKCTSKTPPVFARLTTYVDWIHQKISELSKVAKQSAA